MAKHSKWVEARPGEAIVDVAVRSLQGRLESLEEYVELAATRSDENIEFVHQMRVWSRRAAAAIRLYRCLLPRGRRRRLEKRLQRIRRAANDARDDDVFAARLVQDQARPGAARLLEKVREHRREAQEPILAIHDELIRSGRFARRVRKLLKKARWRGSPEEPRFDHWSACRIRNELDRFLAASAADLSDLAALHKFRIAGKKLRYRMELLAAAFPESFRKDLYPVIQDLQERLGQINDHATAQLRLWRWMDQISDPETLNYAREIIAQEAQSLDQRHREFFEWWKRDRESQLRASLLAFIAPLCPEVPPAVEQADGKA